MGCWRLRSRPGRPDGLELDPDPACGHAADCTHASREEKTVRAKTDKRIVFLNNTAGSGVNADVRKTTDAGHIAYLSGMRPALAAISHAVRPRMLRQGRGQGG